MILLIEESILATDLAIYFKNRASTFSLLARWTAIGQARSRDPNTGLWLANVRNTSLWLAGDVTTDLATATRVIIRSLCRCLLKFQITTSELINESRELKTYSGYLIQVPEPIGSPEFLVCVPDIYSDLMWVTFQTWGAALGRGISKVDQVLNRLIMRIKTFLFILKLSNSASNKTM